MLCRPRTKSSAPIMACRLAKWQVGISVSDATRLVREGDYAANGISKIITL